MRQLILSRSLIVSKQTLVAELAPRYRIPILTYVCALPSQQSHLFPICVVLCFLKSFLFCTENVVNSFPSPEKILFCTGTIESIEWLNLAHRQRIDDCFEIHFPHWKLCDSQLSNHQILCPKYCFDTSPSARSPCDLCSFFFLVARCVGIVMHAT